MATSIPRPAEPLGVDRSAPAGAVVPTGSRRSGWRIPTTGGIVFVVGATAFVLLVALFAVSRSPLFGLRTVTITGGGHRSPAEIGALADLADGANVAWLDTAAVERRLESDPWIARAVVRRHLPWTVSLDVTERAPVAVLAGPRPTYVAADGTVLGPASGSSGLPVIMLPPAAPATIGVPGEDGAVRALASMPPAVRHGVREVDVAVGGTLTLRLRGGSIVEMGLPVDLGEKDRVLRRLLTWERSTGMHLQHVSLLAPTAPAATLAG